MPRRFARSAGEGGPIILTAVAILLTCQLCGEAIARALDLPLPGPVLGLALLATLFVLRPALFDQVSETTRTILSHLSLLFVPAGVGVVASLDLLSANGPAIAAVLLASTVLVYLAADAVSARLGHHPLAYPR